MEAQTKLNKPNSIELKQDKNAFSEDMERSAPLFREGKKVALFGGSAIDENSGYFKSAKLLAKTLAKQNITVITGGGPGIMKAGNTGAVENGETFALRVEAIHDENDVDVSYIPDGHLLMYKTLAVRLLTLIGSSDAIVFFPGGFGTLEEMFSLLVRIRVGMMKKIPVYFYGSEFWNGLKTWISDTVFGVKAINENDIAIFRIEDDINKIAKEIIEQI